MPNVELREYIQAKLDETTDALNELVDQRDKLGQSGTMGQKEDLNKQIRPLRRRIKEMKELLQNHQ